MDLWTANYTQEYEAACLELFDQNAPEFFALNERRDLQEFLRGCPRGYHVVIQDQKIVAAFGLIKNESAKAERRARLSWIMVDVSSAKTGVGRFMMSQVFAMTKADRIQIIDIAASHLSRSYFAKYGAVAVSETQNGWGPNMHRVDMCLTAQELAQAI